MRVTEDVGADNGGGGLFDDDNTHTA